MSRESTRVEAGGGKFWPVIAAISVVVAASTMLLRHGDKAAIATVRQEVVGLKAELETRESSLSELQAKLEASLRLPPLQPLNSDAGSLAELGRRFEQLAAQESNTLALIQSIASKMPEPEPSEVTRQRRQSTVNAMESQISTQQAKYEAAKAKVEQLATAWNLPDELATMEVALGLDSVTLKPYWPYFEAKRERDVQAAYLRLLNTRIEMEKLDQTVDGARDALPR